MLKSLSFSLGAVVLALSFTHEMAAAQSLEKLIMPGRVIAGHAEFESECAACHVDDANEGAAMDDLCIACHEDVGEDRLTGRGFHGRSAAAADNDCVSCHTDHEGRSADIVPDDGGFFSHDLSDFPLTGAHVSTPCTGCHLPDTAARDAPSECIDCHENDDPHEGQLGPACATCHITETWGDYDFDHATLGYALLGGHEDVACADCHGGNEFASTPATCASCHAVDDVHAGSNGSACDDCHTVQTWSSIGFNHALETGFALTDGHGGLDCQDCHTREDFKDGLSSSCSSCHLPDDDHQGRNGEQCGDCHRPTVWSDSTFQHADTGFVLQGAHEPLSCAACHKASTSEALPTDCGSCHALDDAHTGQLGNDCAACHSQDGWQTAVAFDHDLSSFPLIGMHAAQSCDSCHSSARFHDASSQCGDCHADDDVHEGALGVQCGDCHTSNDWLVASFDHEAQTGFALDGGHTGLTCTSCHRSSSAAVSDVPTTCGGCHRSDDVHNGQFGMQCERCHSSSSFSEVGQL